MSHKKTFFPELSSNNNINSPVRTHIFLVVKKDYKVEKPVTFFLFNWPKIMGRIQFFNSFLVLLQGALDDDIFYDVMSMKRTNTIFLSRVSSRRFGYRQKKKWKEPRHSPTTQTKDDAFWWWRFIEQYSVAEWLLPKKKTSPCARTLIFFCMIVINNWCYI